MTIYAIYSINYYSILCMVLQSVSIEEFLKPADGERYNSGGRGRGRGRGFRGGYTGGNGMNNFNVVAPSIEDVGQFPSLNKWDDTAFHCMREANGPRGGGHFGGRRTGTAGQGGRAFNRDSYDNQYNNGNNNGGYRQPLENGDSEKPDRRAGGGYRPKRGDYFNGDAAEGERPKRVFERHSVIGRGNEFKREGAGRGNWGRIDDVVPEVEEVVADTEKVIDSEKQEETADTNKENTAEVAEQKEPEKEQMTLEEYEKLLEEKRKALVSLKSEERK
nr:hyaluronan/mRNA-binding protein [Tanacetum cinerariifolium]